MDKFSSRMLAAFGIAVIVATAVQFPAVFLGFVGVIGVSVIGHALFLLLLDP